jgi:hypothetical protein
MQPAAIMWAIQTSGGDWPVIVRCWGDTDGFNSPRGKAIAHPAFR